MTEPYVHIPKEKMRTRVKVILASRFLIRLKWFSTIVYLIASVQAAAGWLPWNFVFGFIGALGWTSVGWLWNDRSLIILNAFTAAMMIAATANYIN